MRYLLVLQIFMLVVLRVGALRMRRALFYKVICLGSAK